MQFSKKITSKRCSHDSHILCINGERGRVWFEAVLCSTCSLHVHTLIRNHTVDWCYGTVLMIHHIWVYTDKAWELGIWTSKHQIATWQSSLTSVEFHVCFLVFWLIYWYCILWKFDLKWISKANKTNNTSGLPFQLETFAPNWRIEAVIAVDCMYGKFHFAHFSLKLLYLLIVQCTKHRVSCLGS